MTIAEQLNDVIDVLSERLGVAADYVYQAVMNQAQLVLIRNIIFLLICISIFAVTGIYMKKTFWDKDANGYSRFECASEDYNNQRSGIYIGMTFALAFVSILAVIWFPFIISTLIQVIGNPEYYVLRQIMGMIQ